MNLTKSQQRVFDLAETTSNNLMILGKPGVGKSVTIRNMVENGRKYYSLAAPTGIAAINIQGKTLHSLFGIPTSEGIIDPTYNVYNLTDKAEANLKYHVKHLIIDEISMVRADIFDYINRVLKYVKGNDLPFGGIQLICVGDFCQLPPVAKTLDMWQLKQAGYESPFMFHSYAYAEANFTPVMLNEVLRQKGDPEFIKLLDAAREGDVKPSSLRVLNQQVGFVDDLRIKLCGTNPQADAVNKAELAKIKEPGELYTAREFGEWPQVPIDRQLTLKKGAQVMVKMNGADRHPNQTGEFHSKVVNGTIGKVLSFHSGKRLNSAGDEVVFKCVEIEMENGQQATIYNQRWERKVKKQENGQWTEQVVASYDQMPLCLAWAISIHKSQGQTFDRCHIDATKIFAAGQMYVALSRCRSIAGISLSEAIEAKHFWTDVHVKRFFNSIEELV